MRKWIDMHCDTLSELLSAETLEENSLCVDRKRMEQTKMLAEFFCMFCMCTRWKVGRSIPEGDRDDCPYGA